MKQAALSGSILCLLLEALIASPLSLRHKFSSPDPEITAPHFGAGCAIDGTLAVIGSDQVELANNQEGVAYLYNVTTKEQVHRLEVDLGDTFFGYSADITTNYVAVGAPGGSNGAAYLFSPVTGLKLHRIANGDDDFGWDVALDDGLLLVGSRSSNENGQGSGSAHLYNATAGTFSRKLLPDDGTANDSFGWDVDLDGGVAIIGTRRGNYIGRHGVAYLFDVSTGQQLAKLMPDDGVAGDGFGRGVGISGNLAVVAGKNGAYVFDVTTTTQLRKLIPDDLEVGLNAPHTPDAVAIDGDHVLVGWHYSGNVSGGVVYVFDAISGAQLHKLCSGERQQDDTFGSGPLAVDGNFALIGTRSDDAAYLFDVRPDGDQDGLADIVETGGGTYSSPEDTGSNPVEPDTDGDGLRDGEEVHRFGTNPNLADTDGDGFNDKTELDQGFSPTNSADAPAAHLDIHTAVEVNLTSEVGINYQIEYSTDGETWLPLPPVLPGTGNPIQLFYSIKDQPKRLFRAVAVP